MINELAVQHRRNQASMGQWRFEFSNAASGGNGWSKWNTMRIHRFIIKPAHPFRQIDEGNAKMELVARPLLPC